MSSTPRPQLTIITVTYNDVDGVRTTLDSLNELLLSGRVESLVIDGGTDSIQIDELRSSYPASQIFSEPDDGLYDAMNKGIVRAKGNFLWFLNGGDSCEINSQTLLQALSAANPSDIVLFGYLLDLGNGVIIRRKPRHRLYLWHALPTSHQAIFYGREAISGQAYDLSFQVSADYAFTLQAAKSASSVWTHRVAAARFTVGGTSTINASQIAADAARAQRHAGAPRAWSVLSGTLHRFSAFIRRQRSK